MNDRLTQEIKGRELKSPRHDLTGRRLHFVGVGGSGMSGLAKLAAQRGASVSGSDRGESAAVAAVRDAGIDVTLEQTAASVPEECDTVVISAAIPPDHPEVVEARRRGVEVVKYAAMLGRLMASPGTTGVAIAGTHGKSTTTSILCHVLLSAGLDPSFILGAHCEQIGGGSRAGGAAGGTTLIAEACEYDRSFHNFAPTHATILNVEADHLDLYKSIDEIVESFATFARLIPGQSAGGSLLIQHESPHRLNITAGLDCGVETLGFASQADWRVTVDGNRVTLHERGEAVCAWDKPLPGDHFAFNAAAAAVTAHRLGAAWDDIGPAIAGFQGLDRRMQTLGRREGVLLLDDYGHHPTEVDTTLRALRQHHDPARLICVFQPHQHSRTRHLMEQFVVSFGAADIVVVPEIFFVRDSEQERQAVTSGALVERLRAQGVTAMHLHPFDAIVEQLQVMAKPGDLIVTMGAGDVWKIGRGFLGTSG
ncbi:MAG: UDP-N-acetylmuramate--L-alanine ligase [Planctomycetota bacterium]